MISGPGCTCQEEADLYDSQNLWFGLSLGQPRDRSRQPRAGNLEPLAHFGEGEVCSGTFWKSARKGLRNGSFRCMRVRQGEISPRSRGTGARGGLEREGSNSNDFLQ